MKTTPKPAKLFFASQSGGRLTEIAFDFFKSRLKPAENQKILLMGDTQTFSSPLRTENYLLTEYEIQKEKGAFSLPYATGSFDAVFFVCLSNVFCEYDALFREINRVCSPDATLILLTKNKKSAWTSPIADAPEFSPREIRAIMAETFFDVKTQTGCLYFPKNGKIIGKAERLMMSLRLKNGMFLLTEARKKPFALSPQKLNKAYKSARMTKASVVPSPRL